MKKRLTTKGLSLKDRLFFYTRKTKSCWLYIGKSKVRDYGLICYNWKKLLAHRVSWMVHYGDIPKGLCVLHKCDNPPCVNPDHLFLGTHSDNSKDSYLKGRSRFSTHPEQIKYGEENPSSKLTESDIRKIRKLSSNGHSQYLIARIFGMSQPGIWKILSGKTWCNVK